MAQADQKENTNRRNDDEPTAPCPICGETVTIHLVYANEHCSGCGSSLKRMQERAREDREGNHE